MWCPWLPWRALFFIVVILKGTSGSVIMKGGKCETAGRAGALNLTTGRSRKLFLTCDFLEIYLSNNVERVNYSKQMLVKAGNTSMLYTRFWTGNTLLNINKYLG